MSSDTASRDQNRGKSPTFELDSRFDDSLDPEEVTVFPGDAATPTTEWLTIDAEYTVPLDDVR